MEILIREKCNLLEYQFLVREQRKYGCRFSCKFGVTDNLFDL